MDMREVYVVAGSFVGFQLFFSCVSPVLSSNFTQGYGKLPPNKLNDWNSRLVSTVHALIVGLFCLYILWYDDAVNEDPVWGDPNLVKLNVAITCGYLFYDLLLLACNWSTMGDVFFVCHHLAALYAYGYVLTRGVLPYFANFRLISELSTPFVNQRWFFEALAYPRTHQLVVANGIAMAVVFFLVRIAVMPPYWAKVFGIIYSPTFEKLGLAIQVAWIISCVCLDILNIIWMYKIARGCYKVITGKLKGRKADSKKTTCVNNHTD
ncbi:TLC domain-containing protein 4-B isoform 1 [Danio rerio]|uniref:TLC domain-containing protein 4-B n=5 Tax=Danio rerio TaxID=7955 RepID=TLC4B_DANRE|nr:TLC domain-containing protein 4-B isoform 1 [Danio rerio]Q5XIY2.1 RecName: Full=TLC domain-containing protein 4-B; AltName: Full=Transmembrane protein 56-B [Danio rerio]AAH83537.1 Transmembrane protein 56 [Danio rerio]AAI64600.1 Tmem56 protein [Danio rerio]|eukprot:NP_001005924.1 transmembrane protein 56-B [Danio rerio]